MRIRLQQIFGSHAGRVLDFQGPCIRLGRHPDNDVPFHSHADLDASSFHAEIRAENGQWVVFDVGSRNGTWHGGRRVERAKLSLGDELEFGPGGPRVRVELLEEGEPAAAYVPETVSRYGVTRDSFGAASNGGRWMIWLAASLSVFGIALGVIAWWLLR